ncbi:actin-like ATPase domain-containing protein [Athelia psychrophila]|uniref:Actin-like ATPase domain-containing protein n=1 Tax=Athelia psychrophila TaxID=1759441 RepID=A0A166UFV9_9AGAM|nr:actin-like ATPase domain-containing protein [Fibularhizoctonia sp. CBS 109695]
MGLTPLNGLPGATRSGAVDPSLIFHYTNSAGKMSHDPKNAREPALRVTEYILNTQSGWKSLTGTTDFGAITAKAALASAPSDENAYRLAFDLFADRILNYVGSYYVKLGGKVDALVFAGGIGEKGGELRERVGRGVECVGFPEIDRDKNQSGEVRDGGVVVGIDATEDGKRVLVCKTNEQLEMARQCALEKKFWE